MLDVFYCDFLYVATNFVKKVFFLKKLVSLIVRMRTNRGSTVRINVGCRIEIACPGTYAWPCRSIAECSTKSAPTIGKLVYHYLISTSKTKYLAKSLPPNVNNIH